MKSILLNQVFPHFDEQLRDGLDEVGAITLYKKGQVLVKTGELLESTKVILSGCVKVYRENQKTKSKEFLITFLKAGQSYAVSVSENSDIKTKTSLVTFKAIEPTYVLSISYADKDLLAKKYDQWYQYILQTAVQFYGFYIELIDHISISNLDERVKYFLLQLAEVRNTPMIRITHQEIADDLNYSRESISRLLKRMEEANKIKLGHNSIEILQNL